MNTGNPCAAWVNVQRNTEESTEPRGSRGWALGRAEMGPAGKERLFSGWGVERERRGRGRRDKSSLNSRFRKSRSVL